MARHLHVSSDNLTEASAIALLVGHLNSERCRKAWIKECRGLITTPEQKQLVALLLGETTIDDPTIQQETAKRYKKLCDRSKKYTKPKAKQSNNHPIGSVIHDLLLGVQHLNQQRYNRSSGPRITVEYAFDYSDRYLYLRHTDTGETFRVSVERIDDHKHLRIM